MWKRVGENIGKYRTYPRLVGETGGKDFIVMHPSADPQEVAVAIARGGFEYQGQKCSAASRVYIPQSLWADVRDRTVAMMKEIKVGDVRDFRNFMGAVIDKKAFTRISDYLDDAKKNAKVIQGGVAKGETGYFIEPTLVETADPGYRLLCEEIFGPVVTAHVYPDNKWAETLAIVDQDLAVCADRRGVRARSRGGAAGHERAAQCRRQLLHQRQADGRGRRPAAVRRRARLRHERQGGIEAQPRALGQRADGQGDVRAAARLQISVHERRVSRRSSDRLTR